MSTMPQLISKLSPAACRVKQALLKKEKVDFQSFLNERFVDPFTGDFSSDRNIEKITAAVDCVITKRRYEEVRIVTDHGKQHLITIRDVLKSTCPDLQVVLFAEEVLIISFYSNAA
jgi:hypothetical protein